MSEIAILNKENYKKAEMIGAYRYLDTASLTENFIDKYINLNGKENNIPSRARRQVEPNDILISTVRPTQKHFGIIEQPVQNLVVSTGFVTITPNSQLVNPYYLYILLTQEKVTNYLQVIAENSTSAYPSIKPSVIADLEFKFPKREIQDKIANLYKAIERKIKVNHQINDNLAQQAQVIYASTFIVNANPSWEKGHLSDLITVKYGKDHKKLIDGNIPVYGSGGVMRYVERPLYTQESVLIPRKGTLNNVIYVNEPFWSVDTMFYTEMKMKNVAKFVYHFISNKDLSAMNAGSAVPSMTTDILNAMVVSIPDAKTLSFFESTTAPIYAQIRGNTVENKKLAEFRDTLLPKLISGEIGMPGIEY